MEHRVRRIKGSLSSEFFTVNDTWLSDCVNYYVSNHNNPPDEEVFEFVKSQWLLSDLRTINCDNGCLPRNLAQQRCIILPNSYILQLDKMYDIATPKYEQLQEIRNISTANVKVTEQEREDLPYSQASIKRRMLQFHLTDGVQDITAIEYQPIPSINNMLLPGYKVMIVGPVSCRRGVMLLEKVNFKEVGGEEESLLICNALENVLARSLGFPENPDPYNDSKPPQEQQSRRTESNQDGFDQEFDIDFENIPDIVDTRENSGGSRQNTSTNSVPSARTQSSNPVASSSTNTRGKDNKKKTQTNINTIIELDEDIMGAVELNEFDMPSTSTGRNVNNRKNEKPWSASSNYSAESHKNRVEKNEVESNIQRDIEFHEDDFDISDFYPIPNKVGTDRDKSAVQKQSNAMSNTKHRTDNFGSTTKATSNDSKSMTYPDFDFDFDEFDYLSVKSNKSTRDSNVMGKEMLPRNSSISSSVFKKSSNAHAQTKSSFDSERNKPCSIEMSQLSIDNSPPARPAVSGTTSKANENKVGTSQNQNDSPDVPFDLEEFEISPRTIASIKNELTTTVNVAMQDNRTINSFNKERKSSQTMQDDRINSSTTTNISTSRTGTTSSSTSRIGTINSSTSRTDTTSSSTSGIGTTSSSTSRTDTTSSSFYTSTSPPTPTGCKRPAMSPLTLTAQKVRCVQETPKQMKKKSADSKARKISEFLDKVSPIAAPPKVCDFLCDIIQETVTEVVFKTVWAKVSVLGKLSKKDSCWQLEGTITDRTACLEVAFASEILEQFLGFSVQEFSQKKKLKKTNPEIDRELRMVFRTAEQKLKNLDALVELELRPNEKARILTTRQLTHQQKEVINKRLNTLLM